MSHKVIFLKVKLKALFVPCMTVRSPLAVLNTNEAAALVPHVCECWQKQQSARRPLTKKTLHKIKLGLILVKQSYGIQQWGDDKCKVAQKQKLTFRITRWVELSSIAHTRAERERWCTREMYAKNAFYVSWMRLLTSQKKNAWFKPSVNNKVNNHTSCQTLNLWSS